MSCQLKHVQTENVDAFHDTYNEQYQALKITH